MSGFRLLLVGLSLSIALSSWNYPCLAKQTAKSVKKTVPVKPQNARQSTPSSFNSSAAGAYLDRLREKMDKHWYLADGTNHVVIKATVLANGSVENVELTSTPKNESAEQAANEAFLKAQPLESLPSGSGERCCLVLDMDSFADPHGDSRRTVKSRMEVIRPTADSTKSNSAEPAKTE